MKAEIRMQFKDGKACQKAHDISSLIGYYLSLSGNERMAEGLEITQCDLSAGEEPFVRIIGTQEEFNFVVGRFPTCQGKPIIRLEHGLTEPIPVS